MGENSLSACCSEIKTRPGKYYVYLLSRPDGTPFYVGKGWGKRIRAHRLDVLRGDRSRKSNIIRKIERLGCEVGYSIDGWFDDETSAFARERELIASLGRLDCGAGPLANGTSGGDGVKNISAEARRKSTAASRAYWSSSEAREEASSISKQRWDDPRHRKRIREAVSLQWADESHRTARIQAMTTSLAKPDVKERLKKASRELWANEDHKTKIATATRSKWKDPEYRAAMSSEMSARWANSDTRAKITAGIQASATKISAASNALWKRKEHRLKRSDEARKRWNDPEYRRRVVESQRRAALLRWARIKARRTTNDAVSHQTVLQPRSE